MNWTYRGKRIRPNDKNLLYHFILAALLSLYLSIFLLFKQLLQMNWKNVKLIDANIHLNIPYLKSSIFTALFVCLLVTYLYYHYRIDHIKQLQHRQKLARMILENGWYESEQVQSDIFLKT